MIILVCGLDGSAEVNHVADFTVAGAWVCLSALSLAQQVSSWVLLRMIAMLLRIVVVSAVCAWCTAGSAEGCSCIKGVLAWASRVDNLGVVQSGGRLLDQGFQFTPLPLVKDWDLIGLIYHMILATSLDTVPVTKVKCHTTDEFGLRIS